MSWTGAIIPLLLAGSALFALGKRVDVYAALTRGAEEGLGVLLRILPALVGLLTAVSMTVRVPSVISSVASGSTPSKYCSPRTDSRMGRLF